MIYAVDADLSGKNFENLDLKNVIFYKSNLTGANFANTNLENADFRLANLNGVNFKGANLENALFHFWSEMDFPISGLEMGFSISSKRSTSVSA